MHAARELSRKCKKTIQINRYLENKIAILREPILPAWQCSCKERRKQSALARWAKDHPACESSVCPAWRLPTNPMFILLGGFAASSELLAAPILTFPHRGRDIALARNSGVYLARRRFRSPVFIPLGGFATSSVYWRPPS